MRPFLVLAVVALAVWLFLRFRDDDAGRRPAAEAEPVAAESGAGAAGAAAGASETLAITTEGGEVTLALRADSVVMRLSDSTLAGVRRETDTTRLEAEGGGVGAQIEKMVKSTVQRALSKQIAVSVDQIDEIRFDERDDAIVMRVRNAPRVLNFESVKVNDNEPVLASFPPDDARRFVAAVQAAKARRAPR